MQEQSEQLPSNSVAMLGFLNVPPPNCPPSSTSTEMRGPPPKRDPPIPPSADDEADTAYIIDDSQYDEPGMPSEIKECYKGPVSSRRRSKLLNNNYEISTSQQIRTTFTPTSRNARSGQQNTEISSSWDDETRQMLLQHPETGTYYIPTSSGHTTASSLSPHSRFYEKANFSALQNVPLTSNPRGSHCGSILTKHRYIGGGGNFGLKNISDDKCHPMMDKKRLKPFCNWRTLAILLLLSLAFTCFTILLLLLGSDNSRYVCEQSTKSVYSSASTGLFHSETWRDVHIKTTVLKPLPESFELGQQIEADLPPGVIVYSYFSVQKNSRIIFNISVDPQAQLVIYGRRTALPSPATHDFMDIVHADWLTTVTGNSSSIRLKRSTPLLRTAILTHYLLGGRWHIGLLNDILQPFPIRLVAAVIAHQTVDERIDDCRYDCAGHGQCKDGRCYCFPGYSGTYCEENSCPVLCSGNGVFSGGQCICHEGYKGPDCDLLSHWCEVPNCNGHGQCNQFGDCECDIGWKGTFCDKKDCKDPQCSGRGVCHNEKCYCEDGYRGEKCDEIYPTESCIGKEFQLNEKESESDADLACSNRGRIDSESGLCICIPGYHGRKCELERCEVECMNGKCGNGVCVCDEGWTGMDCIERKCLPGCEQHGHCNNGTCICNKGWNGENCYIAGCVNDCNGNGICRLFSGQWKCACHTSFFGENCSLPIESNCDDGVDNDNDGLIDCEDSECCTDSSCSSSQMCATVIQPRDVLLKVIPTVNSNFYQQIKFLIQRDSVQRYADERHFNESFVSVIRGRVLAEDGSPLTGVRIAEARHPTLTGFTLSRSEDNGGAFDLVVNGGKTVTLQFMRKPFEKLEKSFYIPWNEIVYVGYITMRLGPTAATVNERLEMSEKCRQYYATNYLAPVIFASWLTSQYSGRLTASAQSVQLLADSGKSFDSIQIPTTNEVYLVYDSSFADGYRSTLLIELLPSRIPEEIRLVHLSVSVAGNHFHKVFSAMPNLTYTYSWEQTNVYTQTLNGLVNAKVSVGYEYEGCNRSIAWIHRLVKLEGHRASRFILGGWSLSVHHHYDIIHNVLEKGDGTRVFLDETAPLLTTVVGSDQQRPVNCPFCDTPASDGRLFRPDALCVGSDGSLYIGDYNLIRRLTPNGMLISLLELSISDTAHPYYLAIDPLTDSLFISLPIRAQIWQINKDIDGTTDLTTNYNVVVGDGNVCGNSGKRCGDGGAADMSQLNFPKGIAFDEYGNLYIADSRCIRIVNREKHINTLIEERGNGPRPCTVDYMDLTDIITIWPTSLAVDMLNDKLYILDIDVIYSISLDTRMGTIIAGTISECEQMKTLTGDLLSQRPLTEARSITVAPDSTIYIAETNNKKVNQIRAIYPDNHSKVIAGKLSKCDCDRTNCPCEDFHPTVATSSFLHSPSAIAVDSKGVVYIADKSNFKIKKLEKPSAIYDETTQQYRIHSPHTKEIYTFNKVGLHVKTTNLLTGDTVFTFTYDVDTHLARLIQITGTGGYILRLHQTDDEKTLLETAAGLQTVLNFNQFDGTLAKITFPSGESTKFSYFPGHLLRCRETLHRNWCFEYDEFGRAKTLINPAGIYYSVTKRDLVQNSLVTKVTRNNDSYTVYKFSDKKFTEEGAQNRQVTVLDEGLLIVAFGARTHFDGVTHPLLEPHETAILKRKITLPETVDPPRRELNLRFEWRGYIRRKESGRRNAEKWHRIQQINGRNVFTIEYDYDSKQDTVRNSLDEEVLTVQYNDAGQITSLNPLQHHIDTMKVMHDSSGRLSQIAWGASTIVFEYDRLNRIILMSAAAEGANYLERKFFYQKENQLIPSLIQMPSGEKYRWRTDRVGGITSLKTPTGIFHHFMQYAMFDRICRQRTVSFSNASYVACMNDDGQLLDYRTPDRLHSLTVKHDMYGRVIQITSDAENIFFKYEEQNGNLQLREVSNSFLKRSYQWQGMIHSIVHEAHMAVTHSNRRFAESLVEFIYEYDDFLRLTSMTVVYNGVRLQPQKYQFDSRQGRLTKLNNFVFLYDLYTRRIMSDTLVMEIFYNNASEEIMRKITINELKVVEMSINRHALGWVETVDWTVIGEKRPTEKRSFDMDGQLVQYTIGETDDRRWTLHYDLDGRLKAINDAKISFSNGKLKNVDQVDYTVNANGWTRSRDNMYFEYDVYGRVHRVYQPGLIDVEYGYDDRSRIIWRRVGDEQFQRFFYAIPNRPYLLTHFASTNETPSTILYDDRDIPFALYNGDRYYALFVDIDGSVRFIFASDGTMVKEIVRNPLGATVVDTNDRFYFPLGYRHQFDDPLTGIVILGPEARPYDTFVGRFMSVSVSFVTSQTNIFAPEYESDPFRAIPTESNLLRHFPLDLERWMEMSGFSLSQALPSVPNPIQNDGLQKLLQLPDSLCTVSATHVLSSSFCSLIYKVKHFKQFLTTTPPQLLPLSHLPFFVLFDKLSYSASDSVGFRGMTFVKRPSDKFEVIGHSLENDEKLNTLRTLLNDSSFLNIPNMHLSGDLVKIYFAANITSNKIPIKELAELFNISNSDQQLTLQAGNTQLIFHYNNNMETIKSELIRQQTLEISKIIWEDEVERARYGAITRHSWTESELLQLSSEGFISGYELKFRPGKSVPILTNTYLWTFQRVAA
ncbi:GHH signature containing HNH/Endo VII nuclease toxin family protein [Acanthocheilonema viteae]